MKSGLGSGEQPMPSAPKVLVVGTTPDYIHWIEAACPGEALFLTDPVVRELAAEPRPAPPDELYADLSRYRQVLKKLEQHLAEHRQELAGISCFDCESMELAAILAAHYDLSYPSVQTVRNCRNKYRAKTLWQRYQLDTPPARRVRSANDAVGFFRQTGGPIVLKPISGSGSELVLDCKNVKACERNFHLIRKGLQKRKANRLYEGDADSDAPRIMAEKIIDGEEYSCDFTVERNRIRVLRLTKKIKIPGAPFGTTAGYLLPAHLPGKLNAGGFGRTILLSATILGIDRGICMLDFMVSRGRIVLLELAPRPGGDCLPHLLRHGYGLDMLKLQLDFCRHRPLPPLPPPMGTPLVGLRLHARENGSLKCINPDGLMKNPRIREIHFIRKPGHRITLPPQDYDSWLLGHIIFTPDQTPAIEIQCSTLLEKIRVEVN